jgi:SNF2 family DNA or RNA helicase
MSSDYRDINEIDHELLTLAEEEALQDHKYTKIQEEITVLRQQLSDLSQKRTSLRMRKNKLKYERESSERQVALEAEQRELEKQFKLARDKAEALIANAPWRDGSLPNGETIYGWQLDGALKLANATRGILADSRGMGKTLTALAWRRMVDSHKTLVLVQKSVIDELAKEIIYWEPNTLVMAIPGSDDDRRQAIFPMLKTIDDFIVLINIESWRRSGHRVIRDIQRADFDAVILDEAHKVKEKESATARGYFEIISEIEPLLQMTGTPIQNRPQELFSLLHAARPSLFPDLKSYRRDYCEPVRDEYGYAVPNRWKFKPGGLRRLMDRMGEFFVGRTPEDVGHKIPPPKIHKYDLDFTGYSLQEEAYRLMARQGLAELPNDKVLPMTSILAIMTKQAQILSWPHKVKFYERDEEGEIIATHYLDAPESTKIDWAEDFIKELGEPVILFSRFVEPLNELKRRLSDELRVGLITGDTTREEKNAITYDFDPKHNAAEPKYDVVLATYGTVSESVNLNRARHVILFDRNWKPAADDQAIGRVDRINSVDQANVHMPQVEGSFDEFMDELIDFKRGVITDFKSAADLQAKLTEHLRKWA